MYQSIPKQSSGIVFLFGATIFAGAFLLFQVQPVIAKFILPWFGGTPAVWTTCMMFFQIFLLLGYLYAHILSTYLPVKSQVIVHIILLVCALILLPIVPAESWKPETADNPTMRIIFLLTATLGLPYLVLSSTSPLIQRWFSLTHDNSSPYRLYALSNAGSFLALVSYPFIVEPLLSRNTQAVFWSWMMGGFVIVCAGCAFVMWQYRGEKSVETSSQTRNSEPDVIPARSRVLWLVLPAIASLLLLSVTNKLCQDIAVVPFLWILPLMLYLLSFIICFDRQAWYSRVLFGSLFVVSCAVISMIPFWKGDPPLLLSMVAYPVLLFAACMICHGELYRLKPASEKTTAYYLTISLGGAIGGIAVVVVAPVLFTDYTELVIGVLLCAMMFLVILYTDNKSGLAAGKPRWAWVFMIALVVLFTVIQQNARARSEMFSISKVRNFYGILKVAEYGKEQPRFMHRTMRHGVILHGLQYLDPQLRTLPTAYFTEKSGVGYCMRFYPNFGPRKVGIIGLGVGTLVAWGRAGDTLRAYEINPAVKDLADQYFTYLSQSPSVVSVTLGDARLSLEREPSQQFDILILDAFNSDSPPVHLLTKEALDIYRRHLKPDGVIAFNITCKYLNFFPVIAKLAEHEGMRWAYIHDPNTEDEFYRSSSTWMLLSNNKGLLDNSEVRGVSTIPQFPYKDFPLWTDDHTSLYPILVWK